MASKIEVADETVRGGWREGEGVAPNVPSSCCDRIGKEACPNEGERILSASETWKFP